MIRLLTLLLVLVLPLGVRAEGLVSLDGAITEIVYALGAGERLVGADSGSRYPAEARDLPSVGYKRNLSAEGVLALNPALVLATPEAGPPEVLAQLRAAGVEIALIADQPTVPGLEEKVRTVAQRLGREAEGEALVQRIRADLAEAETLAPEAEQRPRVLLLLQVGSGADIAPGRDTTPDTLIRLAGGDNVMADAFSGYKPLTAEAAVAAAPQVILVTRRNLETLGGEAGALDRAGLAVTPAGRNRRVVVMDGMLLLGLGPRTGQAVAELARQLHGP